jgi:hypothetical protein
MQLPPLLPRFIIGGLVAMASGSCRKSEPPPPAPAPAAPAPAPAAPAEPAAGGSDADVYFAAIAPYMEKVSIYHGPDLFLQELARAPTRSRHLLTAHWCASEISNGGFNQFFAGAPGMMAPESVAGLTAIGFADSAAVVEEAMALLGGKTYPRDMKARNRALAALKKKRKQENPFEELDNRFFETLKAREGGFDAAAAAYARAEAPKATP